MVLATPVFIQLFFPHVSPPDLSGLLILAKVRTKTYDEVLFSYSGPRLWTGLPEGLTFTLVTLLLTQLRLNAIYFVLLLSLIYFHSLLQESYFNSSLDFRVFCSYFFVSLPSSGSSSAVSVLTC